MHMNDMLIRASIKSFLTVTFLLGLESWSQMTQAVTSGNIHDGIGLPKCRIHANFISLLNSVKAF